MPSAENMNLALIILVTGLVVVFVALIALIVVIKAYGSLVSSMTGKKQETKKETKPIPAPIPVPGGLSVRKRYPCSALGAPCSSEPFFLGRCWIDREHPSFLSREVPLPGETFYMEGLSTNEYFHSGMGLHRGYHS